MKIYLLCERCDVIYYNESNSKLFLQLQYVNLQKFRKKKSSVWKIRYVYQVLNGCQQRHLCEFLDMYLYPAQQPVYEISFRDLSLRGTTNYFSLQYLVYARRRFAFLTLTKRDSLRVYRRKQTKLAQSRSRPLFRSHTQ